MDMKLFVVVVVLGFLSLVLLAFRSGGRIDRQQAHALVADGALLLDVRTRHEFEQGHIEGAIHAPEHLLLARVQEQGDDPTIIVYCHSGPRSARARRTLRAAGYTKVHDLGPMTAW